MTSRRDFITLLGGASAWPLAARAQPAGVPVIGFLGGMSPEQIPDRLAAFRQGLAETGYVEGRNVAIEFRWTQGHDDRYAALAAELVRRQVTVLVTVGGSQPAMAAKAATVAIPIVFQSGADPVRMGLVASLSHPGGNVTGITNVSSTLAAKRLELLREIVPSATTIGVLVNLANGISSEAQLTDLTEAARLQGVHLVVASASRDGDLDAAFTTLLQQGAGALFLADEPFFINGQRERLVALAARHSIPTSYAFREFAAIGGLMSYGTNLVDAWRLAGGYTGRILGGAKPADLPVIMPTRFELVINLKTAKALGLNVSQDMLSIADEVIE
jgi:putative ABC transport system substrate-binding protein